MTRPLRSGLVLLAALTATMLSLSAHAPVVQASGTRIVDITLYARNDVGPDVTVELRDSSNVDVAGACTRGALINPEYDDWVCNPVDGDYQLIVHAPPSIVVDLQCHGSAGVDVTALATNTIDLPASYGATFCSIATTPPPSYPSIAVVSLAVYSPASQAGMVPTLFDSGDNDVGSALCTPTGNGVTCGQVPYGTYRYGLRDAPAGTRFNVSCWVTTTKLVGSGNQSGLTITVDAPLQSAQCTLIAASPVIEIQTSGLGDVTPAFGLEGPGSAVPCTVAGFLHSCDAVAPGDYRVTTDYQVPAGSSADLRCTSLYDNSFEAFTGLDQTITITGTGVEWWSCTYIVIGPSAPTTTGGTGPTTVPATTVPGATTTTTADHSSLPATGQSGRLPWYALGWLVIGAGLLRLTRRPVR